MSVAGRSWAFVPPRIAVLASLSAKQVTRSMILVAVVGASFPAVADAEGAVDRRLRVGRTGIMCIKAPCPSRGVFLPIGGGLNERRRALLYADADGKSGPREFVGAPAAREAACRAWHRLKCIEIIGHLERDGDARPRLHISRILGSCR